jgi:hypothetical protein
MGVAGPATNPYKPELRTPKNSFIVELCAYRLQAVLIRVAVTAILIAGCVARAGAADPTLRFNGDASARTPVFERSGPWMLDWTTTSDNALPKIFELRLYGPGSGDFIGTVVEARETGGSRKMFEDAGRYQVEVVAQHLEWALQITPVQSAEAGRLRRASEGQATIEDSSRVYARQVSEDSFESWRPIDDQTLLLFARDETHGFRITFSKACEGLSQATALMFVSAGYGIGGELYETLMLDHGTHCPFLRVVPTVFD